MNETREAFGYVWRWDRVERRWYKAGMARERDLSRFLAPVKAWTSDDAPPSPAVIRDSLDVWQELDRELDRSFTGWLRRLAYRAGVRVRRMVGR